MFCYKCGSEFPSGGAFCPMCGSQAVKTTSTREMIYTDPVSAAVSNSYRQDPVHYFKSLCIVLAIVAICTLTYGIHMLGESDKYKRDPHQTPTVVGTEGGSVRVTWFSTGDNEYSKKCETHGTTALCLSGVCFVGFCISLCRAKNAGRKHQESHENYEGYHMT